MSPEDRERNREFERRVTPELRHKMRAYARKLTAKWRSPRDDGDDVFSEVMLRAWRHWDTFTGDDDDLRRWLSRIVMNTFLNAYQSRKYHARTLETGTARSEVAVYTDRGEALALADTSADGVSDEVAAALADLRPEFRQVVDLVDAGGASYKEAAEVVGVPIGTIMSRLFRGRSHMKRSLEHYVANNHARLVRPAPRFEAPQVPQTDCHGIDGIMRSLDDEPFALGEPVVHADTPGGLPGVTGLGLRHATRPFAGQVRRHLYAKLCGGRASDARQ